MSATPQDFFIGVIDFFSILLPGAVLAYLLRDAVGPAVLGAGYAALTGTEAWVVFLFSSYLLGHFIFLIGASLLDDYVYDPIRTATKPEQIKRLAEGKKLPWRFTRWCARRLISRNADDAVRQTVRIKERHLDPLGAARAVNAFQWCKARLTLEKPEALETVHRFEADSKFFRSLIVVLVIVTPWAFVNGRLTLGVLSTVSLLLAFLRYVEQRVKATSQAYWYAITLEGLRDGAAERPSQPVKDGPSHGGGVVFKRRRAQVEYLLVQAKNNPKEWVLPKGHIEPGEPARETAVREVHEETGVWARVRGDLRSVSFGAKKEPVKVQFCLMEAVGEGKPCDRKREHAWLALDEAVSRATHKESRELLELAEEMRRADRLAV